MSVTSSTDPILDAVVIAGPTAGGKSALALALARALNGAIINADSQQRYRDLPILTARPEAAEMSAAPHHLFADLGPEETGSAADWSTRAAQAMRTAAAAGRLPILVGGTGLYLRALMEGLADIPRIPDAARNDARQLLADIGNAAFHARLVACDPASARLAPGDRQRMLRAYEVVTATGVALSEWQRRTAVAAIAARYFKIVLAPARADLYAACDARFDAMMARGAAEEVAALIGRGVAATAPIMKVLGASTLAAYLAGALTRDEAVTQAKAATRHYAKRQATWFRHQLQADLSFDQKPPLAPLVAEIRKAFGMGPPGPVDKPRN